MQAAVNMNRFLFSLYIICLVHAQVPKICVNSMFVNDIEGGGGSYLAKVLDHSGDHPQQHPQQNHHQQHQHNLRHSHNQQNHHHNNNNNNYRHHNVHHQAEAHHHVDAGNHNDIEIGHTQPNMVKKKLLLLS